MQDETEATVLEGEVLPTAAEAAQAIVNNPYLSRAPSGDGKVRRVSKWTSPIKCRFIVAIAEGASTTKAANALGLARQGAYYQREIDPEFAVAWDEALELAADLFADLLHEAAISSRHPAFMIFLMKNRWPDRWRDQHEVKTTVQYQHTFSVAELSPERQRALAILALKSLPAPEGDVVDGEIVEPKKSPAPAEERNTDDGTST